MKQSIQLRMGQSLTMTPQLQQAIRLLQLSTLELQAEVQQALDSNPMLEAEDESGGGADNPQAESDTDNNEYADSGEVPAGDSAIAELAGDAPVANGPDEIPVDSDWDDAFENLPSASSLSGTAASGDGSNFENQSGSSETLQEHLIWQMRMTQFTERDMLIAEVLIDAIDEQGYLRASLEDIRDAIQPEIDADNENNDIETLELDEIEAVLHRIHTFDPVGVGARDLRECLMVQLHHLDEMTPWLKQARVLIAEHIELLGSRDYNQLMRRMALTEQELREVVTLIQSLNPRPGSLVAGRATEYIVPDVIVRKVNDTWRVELNVETMPRLRINAGYAGLVRRADNSSDNTYMRDQLQEARWFIKSLQSRNETLLKVATCIVERQRDFLEQGDEGMKALVLHDVAEAIDMHESTISRVTTQKYMHTPRGIFELKYFFSSHVGTSTGGECSATAIRALIRKLVAEEDPRKPMSDNKLAEILGDQGINVARRTIAKYRESISILSSSERKRLI
jgi:RNA polymerase sigma-54 factor